MTGSPRVDVVRRALGDGAWNLAALAVPGVTSLVIVGYLIRTLGPVGFAPWATALAILAILTVLDAGLSATTARNAARALAGDLQAAVQVGAAYTAYLVLAVLVLVLGAALAPVIPTVLDLRGPSAQAATMVGLVLALDLAVVIGTAGWFGTLRGAHRFDAVFVANVVQAGITLTVTILLVPDHGLVGAAAGQLAGRLGGRLVGFTALRRTLSWLPVVPGRVSSAALRQVGVFALPILAIGLSTQLGVGIDPLIVGITSGPAAVGLYVAGSALVRYVAFLFFPILGVLLPSFSEIAYQHPDEVRSVVLRCVRLAAAIGVVVFGSMAMSAAALLDVWIGRIDPLSVQVLVLYALAHMCWAPSQVLILMLIASGRHGLVGVALLVDSILNVLLSFALAIRLGPGGVAISSLIMLFAVHVLVIPAIAVRRLGLPVAGLVRSMIGGAVVGVPIVIVVGLVPTDGIWSTSVRGAIVVVGSVAIVAADQAMNGSGLSSRSETPRRARPRSRDRG